MLKFFSRKKTPANCESATPKNAFIIKPAAQLLQIHQGRVAELKTVVAVSEKYWQTLYLSALENLASLCQELPASEYHHHSYQGGLLAHALDVSVRALKYRIGKILPVDATPDDITKQQQVWTYAVFCSALLHDIGKPLADQDVLMHFANGTTEKWQPLVLDMNASGATSYSYSYYRDSEGKRNYHLHEEAAALFINRIIPSKGLAWIAEHRQLLPVFLHSVLGIKIEDNPIYELVKKADQDSVATDLNGMEVRPTSNIIKSLPERISLKLRQLVDNNRLKINAFGCQGWIKDGFAYMVIKPTLDAIRDDMLQEKQTGIPMNNLRLIDELQAAGVVTSQQINDKYQAKYNVIISHPDWGKQLELSVLRFRVATIWQGQSPEEFSGNISIVNQMADSEEPTVNKEPEVDTTQDTINDEDKPASQEALPAANTEQTKVEQLAGSEQAAVPAKDIEQTKVIAKAELIEQAKPVVSKEDDIAPWGENLAKSLTTPYPNSPPKQAAKAFLKYLSESLNNKSILYNDAAAHVHITAEGIFLVSPKIFRAYDADNWSLLQKGLNSLRVTRKEKDGTNIFKYSVGGKGVLRGMLIDKDMIPAVLGDIKIPAINPKLTLLKQNE